MILGPILSPFAALASCPAGPMILNRVGRDARPHREGRRRASPPCPTRRVGNRTCGALCSPGSSPDRSQRVDFGGFCGKNEKGVPVLNQFTFRSIPFDPEKDFEPITNAFINTQALVVSAALNVNSLDDLAALSKAKPGTCSYSALAIPMQIIMEKWKQKTGADLVGVPSRGRGDIVTGL